MNVLFLLQTLGKWTLKQMDKNKRVFLELNIRSKKRLDFETKLTNSVNQAMQAIIEINDRLDLLEKKQ